MQDLGHVERDEVFGEFSKVFADAVQRSILAIPGHISTWHSAKSTTWAILTLE